jgi:anti-anti-sigma regulatory factor
LHSSRFRAECDVEGLQELTDHRLSPCETAGYSDTSGGILLAGLQGGLALARGEPGEWMSATETNSRTIAAPEVLGLDTRGGFRDEAVGLLERIGDEGVLVVDFHATRRIDSAGLGALMLVQRKASERTQRVVLRNLRDEFRFLLVLTKLDDLFDIEAKA